MKIDMNFNALLEAVRRMGAKENKIELESISSGRDLEFDTELSSTKGIEIDLNDVELIHGLLSYKGRQILLYIRDHGNRIDMVLSNSSAGNKFHVCDCKTLEEKRRDGSFGKRYFVTNNLTGFFSISGGGREEEAKLNVCQNCLEKLNYHNFCSYGKQGRVNIVENFDMKEFFSTYSSIFRYLPKFGLEKNRGYTQDWKKVSYELREKFKFVCQQCFVNLSSHRKLTTHPS